MCIAGAGAAGITLARALADSGLRVAVVETGDVAPDVATQDLHRAVIDTPLYSLADTRLRYFGGTTNHWTGWCRPPETEDFTERPWLPRSGWPLSSSELAP